MVCLLYTSMGEKSTQMYDMAEMFVRPLKKLVIKETDEKAEEDVNIDADYIVDEKARTATLTARGVQKAEEYFHVENLSDPENATLAHHINQAIKAHGVMKRDIDYVIKDGQVVIVDEMCIRDRLTPSCHHPFSALQNWLRTADVKKEPDASVRLSYFSYLQISVRVEEMCIRDSPGTGPRDGRSESRRRSPQGRPGRG